MGRGQGTGAQEERCQNKLFNNRALLVSSGPDGTLWAERFKSVLVEGKGNPLQTMAAYIDLNPVRAGLVEDPKDYRFCGYVEAVVGEKQAREGLRIIWADYAGAGHAATVCLETAPYRDALQSHRELIFGKRTADAGASEMSRKKAIQVLEQGDAVFCFSNRMS